MTNLTTKLHTTLQEAFNTVWQHFVMQYGPPSVTGAGACMYQGPNGARCAFSVLLTSEELTQVVEGDSASDTILKLNLTRFHGLEDAMDQMQSAHDSAASAHKHQHKPGPEAAFVTYIESRLRTYAEDFILDIPGSLAAAEPKN